MYDWVRALTAARISRWHFEGLRLIAATHGGPSWTQSATVAIQSFLYLYLHTLIITAIGFVASEHIANEKLPD